MITRKVKQTRYVIWFSDDLKHWRPSLPMTESEAKTMAHQLDAEGRYFKVATAPQFDPGEDEWR